jgi:DNA repair exonuclease SbcCD ATPase subunit
LREDHTTAKEKANNIEVKLIELKQTLAKIAIVKNETSTKMGFLDRDLTHHRQLEVQLEDKRKEFVNENKMLNRYLLLETVYGLDGIQTRIVKKYLPLLNVYIKEFLDILSHGTIQVKTIINERSKIDMVISGASANSYDMLSGGEKMIVRLAVDVGMALLSFSRSSQKPELICLDEVFGPLDNNHTEAVFEMLKKLQDKFSRVIIITHNLK